MGACFLTFHEVHVGQKGIKFIPFGFRLHLGEDGSEVFRDIDQVEPAALCKGMHEGMSFGRLLASDVLAVLERELNGLDPLLVEVVAYLGHP